MSEEFKDLNYNLPELTTSEREALDAMQNRVIAGGENCNSVQSEDCKLSNVDLRTEDQPHIIISEKDRVFLSSCSIKCEEGETW